MPQHDSTNKISVRPAKTQISLGIRPVWSESLLSAWRKLGSLATHWAHSKGSDQTGRMPRLIWVFAGRTLILLVLSCRGSYYFTAFDICRLAYSTFCMFPNIKTFSKFSNLEYNQSRFHGMCDQQCFRGRCVGRVKVPSYQLSYPWWCTYQQWVFHIWAGCQWFR